MTYKLYGMAFEIGSDVMDWHIVDAKYTTRVKETKYHIRCTCGNEKWVSHEAIRSKIKAKREGCIACYNEKRKENAKPVEPRKGAESYAYRASSEIMEIVDRHWRPCA